MKAAISLLVIFLITLVVLSCGDDPSGPSGSDSGFADSVIATVSTGAFPRGICSLPSGEYVYVTNLIDDNVSVLH